MQNIAKHLIEMGFTSEDLIKLRLIRGNSYVRPLAETSPNAITTPPLNAEVESNAVRQTRTTHAKLGDSDGDSDCYKAILPTLSFSHPNVLRHHQELLESFNAIPAHDIQAIKWFDQYALAELVRFDKCSKSTFTKEQVREFRRNDYRRRSDINAAPSSHEEFIFSESRPTLGCLIDAKKKANGIARRGKRGRNV